MNRKGIKRSIVCKAAAVCLLALSTITGFYSAAVSLEFYGEGIYSGSGQDAVQTQMEALCRSDLNELSERFQDILISGGYFEADTSEYEKERMRKNLMQGYEKENTNFFFSITDKDGKELLKSWEADSQYSFTIPCAQYENERTNMSFTEEEWENYIPPENSWFENEHYFEYYDENYDEGYYNETNAAEDKLYLTATLVTQTEAERYYLTGFVRKDLEASDKYVSYAQLYHLCRKYAYVPPAVEIVSILVWIVCLVYLLVSAGYVRTAEAPQETTFEKIPFDLFSCLTVIAGFILIFGFCVIENYDLPDIAVIASLGIIAALGVLLAVWWLVSLTIRIRTGTILSRNLIVILSRKIHHIFRSIREQLSISWQALIAISGFIFLSFFIALTREPGLYLLLSCAVIVVTLPVLGNLLILEKGLDRLSQGNLEANIPEKLPLFGPFLRYARQLNHVSDSMNKAVGERLKSEMFKTELIANVSHDIRTPLTSIINYTDLLSKLDLQNPEAEEYLEVLTRQSARLRKLTEDVLEASKATTGNIKAELEKLDLRVLLEQVTGEYTERLEKRNLKLLSIIPETPLYLSADGRLMWRVMDNLLGNICKYAMEGSRVYLDVRTENTKIICTLRNMSAQPLNISTEALLERFVRGDRSRNTEGSGLGLSIAKSLTEIQGGKLDLKIDGDLFKVTLEFPEMKIR